MEEPQVKRTKLDLQTDAPVIAAADSTMSAGGSGGSFSMGGESVKEMFSGTMQKGNEMHLKFEKHYRFNMQATLPSVVVPAGASLVDYLELIPGSMFAVPVDYLFPYLSPNEFSMLVRSMTSSRFKNVSCDISSFGIRLPFTTNETTAVTANASSQYPICQWKGLDDDWPVAYDNASLNDTLNKMVGGNTSSWTTGSTFPNLSARQTSREFECEARIQIPYRHYFTPPTAVPIIDPGQLGGDIPLHQYAEVINGTMNLGKVFTYDYSPHFGQFQCQSTHFRRGATTDLGNTATLQPGNTNTNPATFQMGNQPSLAGIDGTMHPSLRATPNTNNAEMIPAEPLLYQTAKVENQHQWNFKHRPEPRRQPMFLVGMQFLRNNDDTLLVANWEVMMSFKCEVECKMGNSGLYGLYNDIPISQFFVVWIYRMCHFKRDTRKRKFKRKLFATLRRRFSQKWAK